MDGRRFRTARSRAILACALCLACATAAAAGEFTKRVSLEGRSLEVYNLIGEIRLESGDGDEFAITVDVRGKDADEDLIRIDTEDGRDARLAIGFPVDEERNYVYPAMGRNKTTFRMEREGEGRDHSGWQEFLSWLGGRDRVKVSGRGSGLEVWADVVVRVPKGTSVEVWHGAGEIRAEEVRADLVLDSHWGEILTSRTEGELSADTGSGRVEVHGHEGKLVVDTGSGGVEVRDHKGGDCHVDTGSGGVVIDGSKCGFLYVDTGSGGVQASGIEADSADIDTGSGGVQLDLVRMGKGRFRIDTGSGGIDLVVPRDASADIEADTGSGSITVDVGGEHRTIRRDDARLTIGDGDADVTLDAGSGSIHIKDR